MVCPTLITQCIILTCLSIGQFKRIHHMCDVHPLLAEQIGYQLRQRVLQELDLLAAQIQARSNHILDASILRRLTRSEWNKFREAGTLKDAQSALAIIVVPKLNTPRSTQLPEVEDPFSSTLPIPLSTPRKHYPLSSLHDALPSSMSSSTFSAPPHPKSLLPVYNGPTFFPNKEQRAILRASLDKLLGLERVKRQRSSSLSSYDTSSAIESKPCPLTTTTIVQPHKEKTSDAYLLRSDAHTLQHIDTVPLAVACWRVRMWEGQGWGGARAQGDDIAHAELGDIEETTMGG